MQLIPMDELEHRRLYRIRCRNLVVGVWNEQAGGFVGVRQKFCHEYPFVEYHYDLDQNFGTVDLMEPMGEVLPDWIDIRAQWMVCELCDATDAVWVRFPEKDENDKLGKYVHRPAKDHDPVVNNFHENEELLNWLKPFSEAEIEARYGKQEEVDLP